MAFSDKYKDFYPFEQNYITHSNGLKQNYVNQGEGEPIVMVHGNPSWSFLYRNLIKDFTSTNQVIVPDHIGCGLSDKPSEDSFPYTLKSHIDNLENLLDSLNLGDNITMVVHDWGGAIGMGYAGRHPEKIKRLVILNTGAFRLPKDCPFPWAVWAFRNTSIGAWFNRTFNAFSYIASHTCSIKGMSKRLRHAFRSPYDCVANRAATTRFVQDIPLTDDDESYSELVKVEEGLKNFVNTPALICFGTKDFVFNRYFYKEWKKRLPNAEAHSFHAGHYILEDVHEKVSSLMQQLIKNNP